jgi:hypothetical protein
MCPFCIGAATWAAAGVISAGGLGVLATVVARQRPAGDTGDVSGDREGDAPGERPPAG